MINKKVMGCNTCNNLPAFLEFYINTINKESLDSQENLIALRDTSIYNFFNGFEKDYSYYLSYLVFKFLKENEVTDFNRDYIKTIIFCLQPYFKSIRKATKESLKAPFLLDLYKIINDFNLDKDFPENYKEVLFTKVNEAYIKEGWLVEDKIKLCQNHKINFN